MAETFEDRMKKMAGMPKEDTAEMIDDVKNVCRDYCGNCPSYFGTGEKELGFCITAKSKAIKNEAGCLCSGCPISEKMSYRWEYYCTRGSGREQSAAGK
jgi:hypothetical protein